jgi:hypothetical protein
VEGKTADGQVVASRPVSICGFVDVAPFWPCRIDAQRQVNEALSGVMQRNECLPRRERIRGGGE